MFSFCVFKKYFSKKGRFHYRAPFHFMLSILSSKERPFHCRWSTLKVILVRFFCVAFSHLLPPPPPPPPSPPSIHHHHHHHHRRRRHREGKAFILSAFRLFFFLFMPLRALKARVKGGDRIKAFEIKPIHALIIQRAKRENDSTAYLFFLVVREKEKSFRVVYVFVVCWRMGRRRRRRPTKKINIFQGTFLRHIILFLLALPIAVVRIIKT